MTQNSFFKDKKNTFAFLFNSLKTQISLVKAFSHASFL